MGNILVHVETRVEHHYVLMKPDGRTAIRKVVDPIQVVSAEEWTNYHDTFLKGMAETQKQLDDEKPPNRAARRKKSKAKAKRTAR
jgi:hypothetical protein